MDAMRLQRALEEIRDLFDGEADASCEPGDDRYRPNRAMQVDMIIDAALAANPNPAEKST